jgi:hypothetical protein
MVHDAFFRCGLVKASAASPHIREPLQPGFLTTKITKITKQRANLRLRTRKQPREHLGARDATYPLLRATNGRNFLGLRGFSLVPRRPAAAVATLVAIQPRCAFRGSVSARRGARPPGTSGRGRAGPPEEPHCVELVFPFRREADKPSRAYLSPYRVR